MIYDKEVCMLPESVRWKLGLLIAALLAVTVGSVVALALVLVTKDKGSPTPTETITVNPSPSESVQSLTAEQKRFLDAIRENPSFAIDSDEELLQVGEAVCTAFDSGAGFYPVHATMVSSGMTDYNAGYMVGSAVGALCPEHTDQLPEEK